MKIPSKFNQNSIIAIAGLSIPALFAHNLPIAPEIASGLAAKHLVTAKHTMIVTNNPWASKAAAQILKQGGNATDAAIAAAFTLGLTEPQSSGIGGGGYALTYHNHLLSAFDGREVAPHSANASWFLNSKTGTPLSFESAMLSAKAVGVPSEVALLYTMHQREGKLAWKKLLAPAIKLARNGFPMSPRLYTLLHTDKNLFQTNPQLTSIYFTKAGQVRGIGTPLINQDYARTLHLIAKNPRNFYKGLIAQQIIDTINQAAGQKLFTLRDFAEYKVLIKPAVCSDYRQQYQICSIPPSASGGVTVAELLGIFSRNYTANNPKDPKWVYHFLEASKLAYADRNQYLADPDFVKPPISGLLNSDYLEQRAQLVNESMALVTPVAAGIPAGVEQKYAPDSSPKPHGTTSIAIVDKDNNAVSMTVTVEHQFGSHLFTNGFFLNNELTDFSLTPSTANGQAIANQVAAGKRPRSSIAPTMIFDHAHHLIMITGSPGGSQIICYVAKNIVQVLDFKQDAQTAVNAGNLCAVNNQSQIESGSDLGSYISALQARGESIINTDLVSGVTNIVRTKDGWSGAADPRREGIALGN